jgi:hypothetical protein
MLSATAGAVDSTGSENQLCDWVESTFIASHKPAARHLSHAKRRNPSLSEARTRGNEGGATRDVPVDRGPPSMPPPTASRRARLP